MNTKDIYFSVNDNGFHDTDISNMFMLYVDEELLENNIYYSNDKNKHNQNVYTLNNEYDNVLINTLFNINVYK